jgi:hypothetical protein
MTDAPADDLAIAPLSKTPRGSPRRQTQSSPRPWLSPSKRGATRRFNEDRRFFRDNPDRSYHARLATAQEVEGLHTSKAWPEGWTVDPTCFVYAIIKHEPPTEIKALYFILPPPRREPREDELDACGAGRRSRLRVWRGSEAARTGKTGAHLVPEPRARLWAVAKGMRSRYGGELPAWL